MRLVHIESPRDTFAGVEGVLPVGQREGVGSIPTLE